MVIPLGAAALLSGVLGSQAAEGRGAVRSRGTAISATSKARAAKTQIKRQLILFLIAGSFLRRFELFPPGR